MDFCLLLRFHHFLFEAQAASYLFSFSPPPSSSLSFPVFKSGFWHSFFPYHLFLPCLFLRLQSIPFHVIFFFLAFSSVSSLFLSTSSFSSLPFPLSPVYSFPHHRFLPCLFLCLQSIPFHVIVFFLAFSSVSSLFLSTSSFSSLPFPLSPVYSFPHHLFLPCLFLCLQSIPFHIIFFFLAFSSVSSLFLSASSFSSLPFPLSPVYSFPHHRFLPCLFLCLQSIPFHIIFFFLAFLCLQSIPFHIIVFSLAFSSLSSLLLFISSFCFILFIHKVQ